MGDFSPEMGTSMPKSFISFFVFSKFGPHPPEHIFIKYSPCVGYGGQRMPRYGSFSNSHSTFSTWAAFLQTFSLQT